jgi:hypothetical protein
MTKDKARITLMVCSAVLAGAAYPSNAEAACGRETLQKIADTYISAQKAGKASALPFASGATYAENDQVMDVSKGVLTQPLTVDFTRSLHDTTQCATFTELVAATHAHPYVIHTRMEVTPDGKISKMESVVTDEGDWLFGATQYLNYTKEENWGEIPADKRDTREVIQAVADAYLDNWGNPDLPVPHGFPCNRLEGRIYTGLNNPNPQRNPCHMGAFPQRLNVTNRRYVIDETAGAVVIFHNFPWLDAGLPAGHPGTPASQMFRVEGGKTRYIHESTVCTTPNCGRGRPPGPPPAGGAGTGQGGPAAPAPGAPARGPAGPGGA